MPTLYLLVTNKNTYSTNNIPLTMRLISERGETLLRVVRRSV